MTGLPSLGRHRGWRSAERRERLTPDFDAMTLGKRLLLFSAADPKAQTLNNSLNDWGCLVTVCASPEDLRGKLEGAEFDLVVAEGREEMRRLVAEADPEGESVLGMTLAEVEKRHILRVLAAHRGNKTQASKSLGIDTKTLYNKLKAYEANGLVRRRVPPGGASAGGTGNPSTPRGGFEAAARQL